MYTIRTLFKFLERNSDLKAIILTAEFSIYFCFSTFRQICDLYVKNVSSF